MTAGTRSARFRDMLERQFLGPKPKLGAVRPCPFCKQDLKMVEGYDMELFLQIGDMVKSGTAWIHAGPEESAKCRKVKADPKQPWMLEARNPKSFP